MSRVKVSAQSSFVDPIAPSVEALSLSNSIKILAQVVSESGQTKHSTMAKGSLKKAKKPIKSVGNPKLPKSLKSKSEPILKPEIKHSNSEKSLKRESKTVRSPTLPKKAPLPPKKQVKQISDAKLHLHKTKSDHPLKLSKQSTPSTCNFSLFLTLSHFITSSKSKSTRQR